MATVQMPSASGIAAAASEPNTASNTIRMMGRFHRSAAAMSCLVLAAAAVLSAPWPMTYSRTRPFSIWPGRSPWTPIFARNFLAASLALLLLEESSRNDTTYGRSGSGAGWAEFFTTATFLQQVAGQVSDVAVVKKGRG